MVEFPDPEPRLAKIPLDIVTQWEGWNSQILHKILKNAVPGTHISDPEPQVPEIINTVATWKASDELIGTEHRLRDLRSLLPQVG